MLPDTDGIELVRQVAELADLPIIFISAYRRDETVAKALGPSRRRAFRRWRRTSEAAGPRGESDPVDGLALRLEHVVEAGLDQLAIAVEELAVQGYRPDSCKITL